MIERWSGVRRILAVRLDAMGDVVMTGPALAAMQASGADVTLLTSPAGAGVAALMPAVGRVIAADVPWMKAPLSVDLAALAARLGKERFDAAVIFTVHSQSALPAALLCHLAGIPRVLAHCRENPYGLLSDWVPETEPARLRHEVRRQIDLVAAVGFEASDAPVLAVPPEAAAAIDARLAGLGVDAPWAVVHPGASAASRRYPAEALARAVRTLAARHGWRILVTGSAAETTLAARVAGVPGAHSLAGALCVADLAALIARAPVLVTGNTGPAHLAAALGTPVVDLYALTNLQHAPWHGRGRVLFRDVPCRGCLKSVCPEGHHLCLRGVSPEAIVAAAREAAAGRSPAIPEEPAAVFGRAQPRPAAAS